MAAERVSEDGLTAKYGKYHMNARTISETFLCLIFGFFSRYNPEKKRAVTNVIALRKRKKNERRNGDVPPLK